MPITLELYTEAHREAAVRFNRRYLAVDPNPLFVLSEQTPHAGSSPPPELVERHHYLLVDGAEVRGGVIVQRQDFIVNGRVLRVGNVQSPLSEGIFDRKYAQLGVVLIRKMALFDRFLYGVGMGGVDRPFPRILTAMRWRIDKIPFFFRIARATRFLTQIAPLQSTPARRAAARLAAYSGAGPLSIALAQTARRRFSFSSGLIPEPVAEWGSWADELWEGVAQRYSFAAIRTAAVLDGFNPLGSGSRLAAWRFRSGGQTVGWAVLTVRAMQNHPMFGDLRLGTLLDAIALPGREAAVAAAASEQLESAGADLLVSNQWHPDWQRALEQSGYFRGPSKYLLGLSPELLAEIGDTEADRARMHVNRADGDGRVNL